MPVEQIGPKQGIRVCGSDRNSSVSPIPDDGAFVVVESAETAVPEYDDASMPEGETQRADDLCGQCEISGEARIDDHRDILLPAIGAQDGKFNHCLATGIN